MNNPVTDPGDPLVAKIGEIYLKVGHLREQIAGEANSLQVIQEATEVRTCLDELEKLVFERFSRECFLSALDKNVNDVGELLVVFHRLFR